MLLLIVLFYAPAQAQPLVNTTEGIVEGLMVTDHLSFYGIPYAGPVNVPNRFKAAPPPELRPDVFLANHSGIQCAHPHEGIENCLTLNIFTKNLTTSSRPVLVYLDAREYTKPITNYHILTFMNYVDKGVVVVSLNYRLSIFGFLCLGVEQAPGNAGIKDIIQGLEWINKNIEGFGGDPKNVMLIGHGSAAALVDIVTMVPRAKNLVHKAVTLSGSALAPWAVAYTPVKYAEALGKALGYSGISRTELAKRLVSTDIHKLVEAIDSFTFFNNTPLFAPCIENENVSSKNSVLTDSPINIIRSGNYSHIPYITAYVTAEGTLRSDQADSWIQEMSSNFKNFLPVDLDFSKNDTVESLIWDQYFNTSLSIPNFERYQGDILVVVSVIRGARERAVTSKAEVRLMEFGHIVDVVSNSTSSQTITSSIGHGEIQRFLIGIGLHFNEDDVSKSLISRIIALAYNGIPSAPSSKPYIWPPITQSSFSYLTYGLHTHNGVYPSCREDLSINPHQDTMAFWNPLYSMYYRTLSPVTVPESSARRGAFSYVVILFSIVLIIVVIINNRREEISHKRLVNSKVSL